MKPSWGRWRDSSKTARCLSWFPFWLVLVLFFCVFEVATIILMTLVCLKCRYQYWLAHFCIGFIFLVYFFILSPRETFWSELFKENKVSCSPKNAVSLQYSVLMLCFLFCFFLLFCAASFWLAHLWWSQNYFLHSLYWWWSFQHIWNKGLECRSKSFASIKKITLICFYMPRNSLMDIYCSLGHSRAVHKVQRLQASQYIYVSWCHFGKKALWDKIE